MSVSIATLRVGHESTYANLTRDRDLTLDMWCNDHCDLLRVSGSDRETVVKRIDDTMGVRDVRRADEEIFLITEDCLRIHETSLIEEYLETHDCLWRPPQRYANGTVEIHVISLAESSLTELYAQLTDEFPVVVESKQRQSVTAFETVTGRAMSSNRFGLTDRQREALLAAVDYGYYAIPRDHTTAEIADTLGLSRRTFEEHLRRAEGKIVESLEAELRE